MSHRRQFGKKFTQVGNRHGSRSNTISGDSCAGCPLVSTYIPFEVAKRRDENWPTSGQENDEPTRKQKQPAKNSRDYGSKSTVKKNSRGCTVPTQGVELPSMQPAPTRRGSYILEDDEPPAGNSSLNNSWDEEPTNCWKCPPPRKRFGYGTDIDEKVWE